MKQFLMAFSFLCLMIGTAQAAVATWTAVGWGTALSGTAYLIQSSATEAPDISTIATYLEENGTQYQGDGFSLIGATTLSDALNLGGSGVSLTLQNNLVSLENFFTLIVTNDGKFYLSSYVDAVDMTPGAGTAGGEPGVYNIEFKPFPIGDVTWTEGILGGDTPIDPDVPEPTALALLALGVAGVALRRRVA